VHLALPIGGVRRIREALDSGGLTGRVRRHLSTDVDVADVDSTA